MRLRRLLASRGRGWLRTRQLEIERRSLTHDTVEPNGPSHRMHQLLGDAQPQPGPVEPSRSRRIRLRELLKTPRPELLGNPSAVILDLIADPLGPGRRPHENLLAGR